MSAGVEHHLGISQNKRFRVATIMLAFAGSSVLHSLGFWLFFQQVPPQAVESQRVLEVILPQPSHQGNHSGQTSQPSKQPPKKVQNASRNLEVRDKTQEINPRFATNTRQLAFTSIELDEPLVILNEVEVEPDYGFADDVSGSIELTLLVGSAGNVLWIESDPSEFDHTTKSHIINAFRSAKFTSPRAAGYPVTAIYRITVAIHPQEWRKGRGK